ncbi:Interleukin-1 receptor type 1 [Dissostichus eleginoides]|uniref:Interleukin-1 receptor type 1 n=1 Tax=Dissostichus eleginoides TaxID=100907 RepID=A0AAD9FI23_DISEL|nr:Interleukin-1 receptor type 1 [Dissostichus eleginoides]
MGKRSTLGSLLFFLGLSGICTAFEQENSVPYNITWYDSKTRQEISNETGRTVVRGETLWFLNTRLDNDGEYVSVLRTPSGCYRQNTRLIVELPVPGKCGRPRKAGQMITKGVTEYLSCPLKEYISN